MASTTHRHQSKLSGTVKQAFEDNKNIERITDESRLSLDMININSNRLNERAFFTINDSTVEVILDKDVLSWSRVSGENIHHRKAMNNENMNSIDLHDVYAILPVYNQSGWLLHNNENQSNICSTNSQLRAFQLYSYERMNDNILQEIHIVFQSNVLNQIRRWYQLLSQIISEFKPARNILVICNPYSGSKYSRHVYNTTIKPMFHRAQYNVTYSEISESCSADEVLNDFQGDFNSLYSLVIIGGDGSVINVINALLRYLARENRTRLDIENGLPSLPFPICIVPMGTTNIICHSIHGSIDPCTPILHLLFNQRMQIDMSAIFDVNDNFVTGNFSAGAGYAANALRYFTRYYSYSPKKIVQKSFAKAASNKTLKPIEMIIRYLPADQNDTKNTRCYSGCLTCTPTTIEKTIGQVKIFDDTHVQKIERSNKSVALNINNDNRSFSSSKTTINQQTEGDKHWKILHHDYLHVAVLTNANLWSLTPQGLSKFSHLADGLLDLILIEQTTRKEFLRFIKRHGTSKNQYEFSFTNVIKVKEIKIELQFSKNNTINRIVNIDKQLDSTLSDASSDDEQFIHENKLSSMQKHPPNVPISEDNRRHRHNCINEQIQQSSKSMDLSHNQNLQKKHSENEIDRRHIDSSSSHVPFRRKNIFQSLKLKKDKKVSLPRPSSAYSTAHINKKQNQQSTSGTLQPAKSFLNLFMGGNTSSGKQDFPSDATNRRRSSVVSRLSCVEYGRRSPSAATQYRYKKQPCMWNLDFTPYNSPLIRIKCFYRFLPVFGVGPNHDTLMKEVNYSCFGRLG